jgi:hypothetical protein
MTNTTDAYWEVDGVSLQTYARNIETLGGRDTPPKFRGEDITIPYAVGQRWVPKTPDSRIIPLGMWVRGVNDDGSIPANQRDAYDDNWRMLRNLLWQRGRQIVLKKRFKVNGVLHTATALAEFSDGLEPAMIGRTAGKFTVDLKLADPYFYDDVVQNVTLVNGDQNVTVVGDTQTANIMLTVNGSRAKPLVRNKTLGIQVQYNADLNAGDSVLLDIDNYKSVTTPDGAASFKSNGSIIHAGAPEWLMFRPGLNVVNLSSDSGIGVTTMQIRGAWF